jgi:hypothetical protein
MRILILFVLITAVGCKSKHAGEANGKVVSIAHFSPSFAPGPPVLVYKTRKDYSSFVPVILNKERTKIVGYSHPSDLIIGDSLLVPSPLVQGYFLDKKGINENVAFLTLTYQEYVKLKTLPSLAQMYDLILDKEPLLEICNCGNKSAFTDQIDQLNSLIQAGQLRTVCKGIK